MSPIRSIAIQGDGVAARCCAHLLTRAGFEVTMHAVDRPRVPAIMIGDAAAELIRDVFNLPTLFEGATRVTTRVVAWGQRGPAKVLPHAACVVSEDELLGSLGTPATKAIAPDFTIYAAGALPTCVEQHAFGSRRASAARVSLERAEASASYIESLDSGWLFLVPGTAPSAWLLSIGAPLESQITRSRQIGPLIRELTPSRGDFPCSPRIATPLCGPGWLTCGTAALGFDPICGDGTAHAVREAILASAVVRSIANGGDEASLLAHYENRLIAAMQRHIALCADFYRTGGDSQWWKSELESLREGYHWCGAKLSDAPVPRFRLRDYELEPMQ